MNWNPEYLLSGIMLLIAFFLMYLVDYTFLFPPFLLGLSLILIITGIFEKRRKYYNKTRYIALVAVILVAMLILSYIQLSSLVPNGNIMTYYIGVGFFIGLSALAIVWLAYNFTHKMKKYLETIGSYNKALEIDSKDTVAWNNKGTLLAEHKEYREAINCFDKVLEIDSEDAAALHNKGFVLNKLRKYKEAIEYYNKALKLDPKFESAKKDGKIILEN